MEEDEELEDVDRQRRAAGDDSPEKGSNDGALFWCAVRFSSGLLASAEKAAAKGMRSGKATNLTIFKPQVSTQSSDRPTQVRSGERTLTSPDVGEWDFARASGVVGGMFTVSSDGGAEDKLCWSSVLSVILVDSFSVVGAKKDNEVSAPVRSRVRMAPDSLVLSGLKSRTETRSSVEEGEEIVDDSTVVSDE